MKYIIIALSLTLSGCSMLDDRMHKDLRAINNLCSTDKVKEARLTREDYSVHTKCNAEQIITVRPAPQLYNQH